jgi:hypothetical protein
MPVKTHSSSGSGGIGESLPKFMECCSRHAGGHGSSAGLFARTTSEPLVEAIGREIDGWRRRTEWRGANVAGRLRPGFRRPETGLAEPDHQVATPRHGTALLKAPP